MATRQVSVVSSLGDIPAADWDALASNDDPFIEHAFLHALETSGSVGRGTGWEPRFITVTQAGRLQGAVPLYLKTDSYGEFIFDWPWASAAQRGGIRYYPKMVAAVPFTPVTGHRILLAPDADRADVSQALLGGVRAAADDAGASSVHFLFCTEDEKQRLSEAGYLPRLSMQFHWTNRPERPYRSFDDYLSAFRSANRKQVRKERARAAAHGLSLKTLEGPALAPSDWAALRRFYLDTAAKHGGTDYLTAAFFERIRETFAHRLVATLAYRGDEAVAGAIAFEKGRHLYGRYWGCDQELDSLHFELCYYRLIERAIARGATRFEAGAQGEHKLKRGLLAATTHSAHWLRHPELGRAIERFVVSEAEAVAERVRLYAEHSPLRAEPGDPEPA